MKLLQCQSVKKIMILDWILILHIYYLLKKIKGSKLTIKQKQRYYSFNAGFLNFSFCLFSLTIIYFDKEFYFNHILILNLRGERNSI
jgi:uncharacterized membrane protein